MLHPHIFDVVGSDIPGACTNNLVKVQEGGPNPPRNQRSGSEGAGDFRIGIQ